MWLLMVNCPNAQKDTNKPFKVIYKILIFDELKCISISPSKATALNLIFFLLCSLKNNTYSKF